jgi:hypothetical protein
MGNKYHPKRARAATFGYFDDYCVTKRPKTQAGVAQ